MMAEWMFYGDHLYHILANGRRNMNAVLCGKTKIAPLGYYNKFDEEDLPTPGIPCEECKAVCTMLELAE